METDKVVPDEVVETNTSSQLPEQQSPREQHSSTISSGGPMCSSSEVTMVAAQTSTTTEEIKRELNKVIGNILQSDLKQAHKVYDEVPSMVDRIDLSFISSTVLDKVAKVEQNMEMSTNTSTIGMDEVSDEVYVSNLFAKAYRELCADFGDIFEPPADPSVIKSLEASCDRVDETKTSFKNKLEAIERQHIN